MASEVKPKMARVRNTSGQFAKGGKNAEPADEPVAEAVAPVEKRSEERRVGEACLARVAPYTRQKKKGDTR